MGLHRAYFQRLLFFLLRGFGKAGSMLFVENLFAFLPSLLDDTDVVSVVLQSLLRLCAL